MTCPPGVTEWTGKYIDEVPLDPWGHAYRYVCPVGRDPERFDIVSAGEDGVFGTGDDIDRETRK